MSSRRTADESDLEVLEPEPEATAETPLLRREPPEDPALLYRQNVLILVFCVVAVLSIGQTLMAAPLYAVMESVICRHIHPEVAGKPGSPPLVGDPLCKDPDIQGTLAMMRGWMATFECIPGLLCSIPFGLLSDKWGRKPVAALSLLGLTLSIGFIDLVLWFYNIFPIWTLYFEAVFLLIGGGPPVAIAMLYTVLADIIPVADRATVFFRIMCAQLVCDLITGPLAAILMRKSPWIPLLAAVCLFAVAIAGVLALPETLELRKKSELSDMPDDLAEDATPVATDVAKTTRWQALKHTVGESLLELWTFVLGNKRTSFLSLSIVFIVLGKFVQEMLLQYATKRYGWTWDKAAIVLTVLSASNVTVLLVVLPAASWVCLKYLRMSGVTKDLWLARGSGMLLVAGSLLIATAVNGYFFSFSLVVLSLGIGMVSLVRSLANAMVESHHVGILNSVISFLETIGLMIAGPTLSNSLRLGIKLGGAWIGLPFVCAAGLYTLSTLIVWTFRLPAPNRSSAEDDGMAAEDGI